MLHQLTGCYLADQGDVRIRRALGAARVAGDPFECGPVPRRPELRGERAAACHPFSKPGELRFENQQPAIGGCVVGNSFDHRSGDCSAEWVRLRLVRSSPRATAGRGGSGFRPSRVGDREEAFDSADRSSFQACPGIAGEDGEQARGMFRAAVHEMRLPPGRAPEHRQEGHQDGRLVRASRGS